MPPAASARDGDRRRVHAASPAVAAARRSNSTGCVAPAIVRSPLTPPPRRSGERNLISEAEDSFSIVLLDRRAVLVGERLDAAVALAHHERARVGGELERAAVVARRPARDLDDQVVADLRGHALAVGVHLQRGGVGAVACHRASSYRE